MKKGRRCLKSSDAFSFAFSGRVPQGEKTEPLRIPCDLSEDLRETIFSLERSMRATAFLLDFATMNGEYGLHGDTAIGLARTLESLAGQAARLNSRLKLTRKEQENSRQVLSTAVDSRRPKKAKGAA